MAASARNPEPAPPSATDRLTAAQAELEQTNARLAELNAQRAERLLADDTPGAVSVCIEASNLALTARALEEKIALLREKAAEEDHARRARRVTRLDGRSDRRTDQRVSAIRGSALPVADTAAGRSA